MKRRKILVLIPALGLLLSGCTFQEGFATAKHWVGQNIYHPVKDWIESITGKKKDEQKPEPGPSEKTVASIVSVSAPSTIKQGETLAESSVTLNVKYSDDSTGTEKATRVELDTSEPGEKEGTAYYNELSAKFNITVEKKSADPEHAGTDEDPFTVEDALLVGGALEKGGVTDKEYVIRGFVTSVKADFSTEYGNLTFNMGDFLCYRVFKGSEKAKFESQDDVQVGDRVTVHSKIKNYNGTIETLEKEGYTTAIEKVDHGKISEIVSVVGPTSVALNGTIAPEEVTVKIKYEDGFVTTVHAKTVELDTKTAGDKEAVVTIDGFEGTGKFAVKVIEGELPNEIEAAYAKAVTLKNDGSEVSSEAYLIRGVVVGTRGTDDYFVQSGSYGLDVYKPDSSVGFAVGKEVELKATVCNYKGLYETKTISEGTAKVIGDAQLPTPADVTSESVHNELKMNILAKASGVVKEDVSVVADKDVSFALTVGGSYDVTIFVKKALVASFPALSTYKAGDALTIENLVTGQYNTNKQLLVCNNTTISKGVDPAKTVTEILNIDGPTSVEVGQTLSVSQFDVEVKYDDNSTAHVSATSLGEFDNSKAATHVGVEVYVGEVHETYYIDVVEKQEEQRQSLPYVMEPSNATLPEGWTGNGEAYFATLYAFKAKDEYVQALELINPVSSLQVDVKGATNTAQTPDNEITVYGLNDAGDTVASETLTPDVINVSKAADFVSQSTTKTVTLNGTGITGVKVALTKKTHNYGLVSVTLSSTVPVVDVTSVSLDSHELALHLDGQGEQQPGSGTLTATVLPNDATDPSVTWTTSDDKVATVEGGVVTAVGQGTATITATAGAQSDTCTVSVAQHVKSMDISGPSGVVVGETSEQAVTVEILPANAPQGVTIVSLDETKATINNEHKIVGVAEGDVTIRATSTDNSLVAEYVVHVAAEVIPVTSVEIEGAETQNLNVGSDLVLSGAVVPPNTTQSTELIWSIVSGDAVTLEGSTVTGVHAGDAVIRATAVANSECHDEVTIHVSNVPVTGITLDKDNLNLAPEGEETLVATIIPENATVQTVEWSSDDSNVATVDQTGHVVAIADGTATITVAWTGDSSVKATCSVTVETPAAEKGTIENPYTISEAYAVFQTLGTDENTAEVYVEGYINSDPAPQVSGSKGLFYLTDGVCATDLYAYNVYGTTNQANVTAADIPVGGKALVKGAIKNYGGVFEICFVKNVAGCQLAQAVETPVITSVGTVTGPEEVGLNGSIPLTDVNVPVVYSNIVSATIHPTGIDGNFSTPGPTTVDVTVDGWAETLQFNTTVSNEEIAVEEVVYALDGYTAGNGSAYDGVLDKDKGTVNNSTQGGVKWEAQGNLTMTPWRIGGKSLTNEDRAITSTAVVSAEDITKVVVKTGNASSITVNSITLKVGTSQGASDIRSIQLTTGLTSADVEFTRPEGDNWSGKYFTIVFNVSVSVTSNKFVEFKGADFYAVK